MITEKNKSFSTRTSVGKVMSLLSNILSRLVIAFLPRSKCILISCMQSPSAVILEPKKIKSVTVSTISLSICHEVIGLDVDNGGAKLSASYPLFRFTFINVDPVLP